MDSKKLLKMALDVMSESEKCTAYAAALLAEITAEIESQTPAATPNKVIFYSESAWIDDLLVNKQGGFEHQGTGILGRNEIGLRECSVLNINTSVEQSAAYLFYWKQLPNPTYVYSCDYFIPSSTKPGSWWNIMQWKSTYDGNTDNSWPIVCLDVASDMSLRIFHKPTVDDHNVKPYLSGIKVPTGRWFTLSAEYRKDQINGCVSVYLDGKQIFYIPIIKTTLSDNTLYWSVNNYAGDGGPNPRSLYVSRMKIEAQK
jgi:hypothetical protein